MLGNPKPAACGEGAIDVRQFGQVLAAMECGQCTVCHVAEDGIVEEVDVEMQHIEFRHALGDLIEHDDVVG